MYSTKAASDLTAIKPETLRTWERRFGFPQPIRDEKGRRIYTEDDVEKLSIVSSLVQSGHAISTLTALSLDQLKSMRAKPNRRTHNQEEQQLIADLTKAIEDNDMRRFRFIVGYTLSLHDPVLACEHIIAPTCRLIGEYWQSGKINIGYEHALTSVLREELITVVRTLHLGAQKEIIVFTTPKGENHEIGLLMAGYIAASMGYECQFWGANLPADDLVLSMENIQAAALVMSIVKTGGIKEINPELEKIAQSLPDNVPIWIGLNANTKKKLGKIPDRIQAFESFEPFASCLDSFTPRPRSIEI